ncbi:TPA: hypothetical protein DCZ15_00395 [Candidatus Falkowbacteria bacterium]|nr:hypothetical protein [Candidatus Falkowbacteria bacterium]
MKKIVKFFELVLSSPRRLKELTQKYPETCSLVVGSLCAIAIIAVFITKLTVPAQWNFDAFANFLFDFIFILLMSLCVGGLSYFMAIMMFGEKKSEELSQAALKNEIKLIINTGLINSGAAKTADDLIK